jgi:hypothetical protein
MTAHMKHVFLFAAITALSIRAAQAQEIPSQFDLRNQFVAAYEEPPMNDSIVQAPKRSLLPNNMSIMEKGLWGENGFLRTVGIVSPLTPEERKHELTIRRTMLSTHQIGGFVTLGLMGAACYFGQKIIDGDVGYRKNHQIFVTSTIISYSATGLLAVLAPPPVIRRDEVSTTTIHKALAWVHVAGMIITPILGGMVKRRTGSDMQAARVHQVSAYITTAVFAASMITVTF